jgi:hypothetical protein
MSTRGERRKKARSFYTRSMVVHDLLTHGIKVDASSVKVKTVNALDHDDSHIHTFAPPNGATRGRNSSPNTALYVD